MARTLIVSNRLPITFKTDDRGELHEERSAGGLATGLRALHEKEHGVWLGWAGLPSEQAQAQEAAIAARAKALGVVPIALSADEVKRFYEGYCNGVLWPLFHGFPSQLPLEVPDFGVYRAVNERFADAVAAAYQPGDRVWVHDYQLLLLPSLLRRRLPDARIGFFLHIPFPAVDTFRILPVREALLEGLLGADLIGFHTASYLRNFSSAALHVLGAEADLEGVQGNAGRTRLGVFPMGVDARSFDALAKSDEVERLVGAVDTAPGVRLLVGIDRLDYTKGLQRRLMAYEQLLAAHPELRGKVRLVQVAVPSRTQVEAYAEFRTSVDALIGRINGRFGTPSWAPVHYVYRNLSEADVVALYRAADVLLVTPIRDGMNLVAKEFVASRFDGRGVLVLSEFAGAAEELAEAVHINPYDVEGLAQACVRALEMPDAERRARMRSLRQRVFAYDVHWWTEAFTTALGEAPPLSSSSRAPSPPAVLSEVAARLAKAPELVLLLDYDGTLVPITDVPELARPDPDVLALLAALTSRPQTSVHVVSGRSREALEAWLGHLPIGLHAEHGAFSRTQAGVWLEPPAFDETWKPRALEIFHDFAERTPGSLVEEKRASVAFHYRMSDREYGPRQANDLKVHLAATFANAPVEVLSGDQVVELRPHGANKGRVVSRVAASVGAQGLYFAAGDDRTDEDLFRALPPDSIAVHVGDGESVATVRVEAVEALRAVLARLL